MNFILADFFFTTKIYGSHYLYMTSRKYFQGLIFIALLQIHAIVEWLTHICWYFDNKQCVTLVNKLPNWNSRCRIYSQEIFLSLKISNCTVSVLEFIWNKQSFTKGQCNSWSIFQRGIQWWPSFWPWSWPSWLFAGQICFF